MIETSDAIVYLWQCYASLGSRNTGGAPKKIGRCPVGGSDKRHYRHPYDKKIHTFSQDFF